MSKLREHLNEAITMDISFTSVKDQLDKLADEINQVKDQIIKLRKQSKAFLGRELKRAEMDAKTLMKDIDSMIDVTEYKIKREKDWNEIKGR